MDKLLEQMKAELKADLVAVAEWKKKEASIQWSYASGMTNERYRHMHILYGLGIVGKVMQSGAPVYYASKDQAGPDPLVNAENLESLFLVPLASGSRLPSVLLVGYRKKTNLPDETIWARWKEPLITALKGEEQV